MNETRVNVVEPRVHVIGAHCTGKTVLANEISKRHHLMFLPEMIREVMKSEEATLDALRADLEWIGDVQEDVFAKQCQRELEHGGFVSDSGIDTLCYAALHSESFHRIVSTERFASCVERLRDDRSVVFFVRPHK